MEINPVKLNEKFNEISDHWNPRIAGLLNGQHIKLVKFKGEFIWHKHDNEDEMFMVIKGSFTMKLREKEIQLNENEFVIIPKGVEHCPYAENEVQVLLFEPVSTLNTGNVKNYFTKENLSNI